MHAVDGVDLVIHRGEALGIAGESGSGKSTLAHAITRLLRAASRRDAGSGSLPPDAARRSPAPSPVDVLTLTKAQLRRFRWEQVAVVFQSAMNALNPVIDIRSQLDRRAARAPALT